MLSGHIVRTRRQSLRTGYELSGSKRRDQLKLNKSDNQVARGRTKRSGTSHRQSGHVCLINDVTAVLLSTDVRDKDGFCVEIWMRHSHHYFRLRKSFACGN